MPERLRGFLKNLFAEAVSYENALPQSQRIAFGLQRFDIQRRIRPRYGQAHRVGTGVDGRDMNRFGHFWIYRQRCASAEEGMYLVARIPNCSPMRCRSCLFTAGTLASPSSSRKLCFLAITSNSRLIIV